MKHTKKRLLSIFLIAMMLCSLIPAPAFAMRIQHNIMAMNSYRNFTNNNNALSGNLEKLSSGYKINRAGDDAVGLAISEAMRTQIQAETGFEVSDVAWHGIYLSDFSESSLAEASEYLEDEMGRPIDWPIENGIVPIGYLTETDGQIGVYWASLYAGDNIFVTEMVGIEPDGDNGVYIYSADPIEGSSSDSGENRYTLSFDVDGGTPINGISTAPGHEINLTDGKFTTSKDGFTFGGLYLDADCTQPAPNTIEMTADTTLYVKWTAGTSETVTNADGSTTTTTTNADGSTVEITESIDGTVTAAASISETAGAAMVANAQDTGEMQIDFAVAGNVIETTVNLPQSVSDAVDEQGLRVYVATSIGTTTYKGVDDAAQRNNLKAAGVPTAGDVRSITLTNNNDQVTLTFTDANGKVIPNVHGGTAVYVADALYVQTAEGELADTNGLLDLMSETAQIAAGDFSVTGGEGLPNEVNMFLGAVVQAVAVGTFDTAKAANNIIGTAGIYDTEQMLDLDIRTPQAAENAIDVIKGAINQVSAYRAKLGAQQNRLEYNVGNLSVQTENITAEESRIRDVDMADEITQYTKNNILIQSAQAMLAQANQVPQGVLSMLQ